MQKRKPFYAVVVFLVAVFITAGCAKQEVVKKDEGIVPAPVARQVEPIKSSIATPQQPSTTSVTQVNPSSASTVQAQKATSIAQLQSALNKIYFNFDSSDLSESARSTLTKNAVPLTKEPTAKIRIEGNCDERGSAEYNLALGERRAKAAQQYLVTLGVKPGRISTISYGKEKPAVQGSDEAAWSKNRRDEFVVVMP
ncbi:MAG: peptidoglycan-associated lipoprotein Pal [Desulfuromonadaceae bacterium]|nr:peptidoglycan-associated lipoprotein Pal [Desulfuromonadaceae bacterium]